ncbi:GNAT family N-acetyltransferase [Clostridium gasigenes]|uniref:GNAT family N-acetyltransferase n=1 Tax=Clostridium gasigenes TaxID=94869 RepID=A0A7X0S9G1_9CLOT|nr:GNAT family N-acetyltransferase [Clostridium gasigenes]MBB6713439.1 GNAT family N-acetyltransferase [Clostridium gasigenes]
MSRLVIRDFEMDDFSGINKLMDEVHKLQVENRQDIYKKTDVVMPKEDFINILSNDKTISIVAEIDSIIVGLCIISIRDRIDNKALVSRKVAFVDNLCVLKDYRKQGIGKRLFNEGKKRALEFGVDSLELMVWEFNKKAIDFYKSENMNTRSRIMELKL